MRALIFATALAAASIVSSAAAHEFWIDPEDFAISPGQPIRADVRVGENYNGPSAIFNPNRFRRYEIAVGDALIPVTGTLGDRPSLNQRVPDEGLAVVIHASSDSDLVYNDFQQFEDFVRHKAAEWVLDAHAERGLPETGFAEVYSRYAKSLIAVGSGAGSDRAFGMETEIVALKNPYTDDMASGMPVRVLYQGMPRAQEQLEVFERAPEGGVRIFRMITGPDGEVTVPVRPGHRYMLDSVVLREPETVTDRVVWESLWANLTFAVPQ